MKTWIKASALVVLAIGLGACSKKSSDNNAAVATTPTPVSTTVPTVSCLSGQYSYNPVTKQYVDVNTGQVVTCNDTNGALPNYGVNNNGQFYSGCDYWNQVYASTGYSYFPVQLGGQIACVRSDLMGQYIPGFNQNIGYYGQQNYYTCNWQIDPYCNQYAGGYNGQGNCVQFGGQKWGQDFGIGGNIGVCW